MNLFGYPVVLRDFMPEDAVLVVGDWSAYIRNATDRELDELFSRAKDEDGNISLTRLMEEAKLLGLIVNIKKAEK